MSRTVLALPVSVEQIALAIRQMDEDDRERLFDLVPELRQVAVRPLTRTVGQAQASVTRVRAEVLAAVEKPLSPDEPFLGNLTLGQYHALPDEEKARLRDSEVAFVYFEAFDQPWKTEDGIGPHWGL